MLADRFIEAFFDRWEDYPPDEVREGWERDLRAAFEKTIAPALASEGIGDGLRSKVEAELEHQRAIKLTAEQEAIRIGADGNLDGEREANLVATIAGNTIRNLEAALAAPTQHPVGDHVCDPEHPCEPNDHLCKNARQHPVDGEPQAVEVLAERIYRAACDGRGVSPAHWDHVRESIRELYRQDARAALLFLHPAPSPLGEEDRQRIREIANRGFYVGDDDFLRNLADSSSGGEVK